MKALGVNNFKSSKEHRNLWESLLERISKTKLKNLSLTGSVLSLKSFVWAGRCKIRVRFWEDLSGNLGVDRQRWGCEDKRVRSLRACSQKQWGAGPDGRSRPSLWEQNSWHRQLIGLSEHRRQKWPEYCPLVDQESGRTINRNEKSGRGPVFRWPDVKLWHVTLEVK